MVYVALLRGINVGGKNKVEMAKLKLTFERLGFSNVKTYINSGNVIFVTEKEPSVSKVEAAIAKDFSLEVPVVIRSLKQIEAVTQKVPEAWTNDGAMKCDVMFLWADIDSPKILQQVKHKPELEDVLYLPGALIWRIDRANVNRGGLLKIVGTDIYKRMTIRNINTVRKLHNLMKGLA